MILVVLVALLCVYYGVKILISEERTTVFNKRPIEVKDVKEYNKACAWLIIGFGVAADLSLLLMSWFDDNIWVKLVLFVSLLVEAYLMTFVYSKIEKKFIKQY